MQNAFAISADPAYSLMKDLLPKPANPPFLKVMGAKQLKDAQGPSTQAEPPS